MRVENAKIKLTIPIPIGKPDANGVVYTEEAVERAVSNFGAYLPICYKDNGCDEKVIGSTIGNAPIVSFDPDNQVCNLTIDGVLFHSGTEIIVNDMTKDGEITDFEIVSVGLTL